MFEIFAASGRRTNCVRDVRKARSMSMPRSLVDPVGGETSEGRGGAHTS